jgi:hypothetical protein
MIIITPFNFQYDGPHSIGRSCRFGRQFAGTWSHSPSYLLLPFPLLATLPRRLPLSERARYCRVSPSQLAPNLLPRETRNTLANPPSVAHLHHPELRRLQKRASTTAAAAAAVAVVAEASPLFPRNSRFCASRQLRWPTMATMPSSARCVLGHG